MARLQEIDRWKNRASEKFIKCVRVLHDRDVLNADEIFKMVPVLLTRKQFMTLGQIYLTSQEAESHEAELINQSNNRSPISAEFTLYRTGESCISQLGAENNRLYRNIRWTICVLSRLIYNS